MANSRVLGWATIPKREGAPPIIRCCASRVMGRSSGTARCGREIAALTPELAPWSKSACKRSLRQSHARGFDCWPIRDSFLGSWSAIWTKRAAAILLFALKPVSYTHLRAHETPEHLVCRLLLEK